MNIRKVIKYGIVSNRRFTIKPGMKLGDALYKIVKYVGQFELSPIDEEIAEFDADLRVVKRDYNEFTKRSIENKTYAYYQTEPHTYLVVNLDNKVKKHNQFIQCYYPDCPNYVFREVNAWFLRGYNLLMAEAKRFYKASWGVSEAEFVGQVKGTLMQRGWRADKKLNSLVNSMIISLYDYYLNAYKNYNASLTADPFSPKKNIDKAHREVMRTTKLNAVFNEVELDSDVDLATYPKFEQAVLALNEQLPEVKAKATLRLRKLGRSHSYGMYDPASKTIVLDFRGRGLRSYVHEYGHFIDNEAQKELLAPLSTKDDFKKLVAKYADKLDKERIKKRDVAYFTKPTEVFAQAFEIYLAKVKCLESNLIFDRNFYQRAEYQPLLEMLDEIKAYFDKVLA